MRHSELKQRIFDEMFNALSLLTLLSNDDIEEVAKALENPESVDIESGAMFEMAASVVRMAKEEGND
jgi:hypothetical protein